MDIIFGNLKMAGPGVRTFTSIVRAFYLARSKEMIKQIILTGLTGRFVDKVPPLRMGNQMAE
jgi:hypothetical protein